MSPGGQLQTSGDFRPPAWLTNRHAQSVFPSLPFRRPGVERRCRELIRASRPLLLDCGEGVRLLAHHATQQDVGRAPAKRLAVLLHGWEGSAQSLYILSLGQRLLDHGFDVVRLNLRDHGESHDLNPGIFHSCRIAEVVGAVQRIQALNPERGINLAGFSLGGNFFLRVAARARGAGIELERVVAVCPVLDPAHTLVRLESGWALYRQYFVWKWHRSLKKKQAAWPQAYDLGPVQALDNLTDMTDHLVRTYGGYPSLQQYLQGYAIVGDALESIAHPTRIISAADDPIIPVEDLDRVARPAALHGDPHDVRRSLWFLRRETWRYVDRARGVRDACGCVRRQVGSERIGATLKAGVSSTLQVYRASRTHAEDRMGSRRLLHRRTRGKISPAVPDVLARPRVCDGAAASDMERRRHPGFQRGAGRVDYTTAPRCAISLRQRA